MTGHNDYGWQLEILNPLEVTVAPKYVPQSLKLSVHPHKSEDEAARGVQTVQARFDFTAGTNLDSCYSSLGLLGDDARYPIQKYGSHVEDEPEVTKRKHADDKGVVVSGQGLVEFDISTFQPTGTWSVPLVMLTDVAGNQVNNPLPQSQCHHCCQGEILTMLFNDNHIIFMYIYNMCTWTGSC